MVINYTPEKKVERLWFWRRNVMKEVRMMELAFFAGGLISAVVIYYLYWIEIVWPRV